MKKIAFLLPLPDTSTTRSTLSTLHNNNQSIYLLHDIHYNAGKAFMKPYYTCRHFCQSTRNLTESLGPTRRGVSHHTHVIAHVTEIFRQRDTCWTGNTGLAGIRVQEYRGRPVHQNTFPAEGRYFCTCKYVSSVCTHVYDENMIVFRRESIFFVSNPLSKEGIVKSKNQIL